MADPALIVPGPAPDASIVITTHNEAGQIRATLAALLADLWVAEGRADVILVDDRSTAALSLALTDAMGRAGAADRLSAEIVAFSAPLPPGGKRHERRRHPGSDGDARAAGPRLARRGPVSCRVRGGDDGHAGGCGGSACRRWRSSW